ncbi:MULTISPECIES: hypothetical protein [unclassified Clostridium]|uniref:hypothetical protein n=1 Tax=unclassified Clostridium TaxID=2614128 RepID=UPI00321694B6
MEYKNEKQLLDALEIDSWKNLSRDKMLKFVAMMPNIDKEVMMKIIDQFPQFKEFAKDVLDTLEETYNNTIDANKESQNNVHNAFKDIRRILENQLNQENLSFEEKQYYINLIMQCGDREYEKDTENKIFLGDMTKKTLLGVGSVLLAAVVFVGGKVLLGRDEA